MIHLNPSKSFLEELAKAASLDSSEKEGKIVTHCLTEALNNGLKPSLVKPEQTDPGNGRPFRMSLLNELRLKDVLIERRKVAPDASLASVTMGLLAAFLESKSKDKSKSQDSKKSKTEKWIERVGGERRTEQLQLIDKTLEGLKSKPDPIVIAEASTGVGKSLGLAAVAAEQAQNLGKADGAVVLAAPNYAIAKQIKMTLDDLIVKNDLNISTTLYRSRAEYISPELLIHKFDDDPELYDEETKKKALELIQDERFLKADYEEIGINCESISLSRHSSDKDPAEVKYLEDRKSSTSAQIIVCTHALLACHVSILRRRAMKTISSEERLSLIEYNKLVEQRVLSEDIDTSDLLLPKIECLLIDEAHSLYDNYASLRTLKISVSSLSSLIKKAADEKLIPTNRAVAAINLLDEYSQSVVEQSFQNSQFPARLTQNLANELMVLSILRNKKHTPTSIHLKESIETLLELSRSPKSNHRYYLSPVRGFLSIENLPFPPNDWLDLTWRLANKALLVSATMALQSEAGSYYNQIAAKLCIDLHRIVSLEPIETTWLRENVTVHVPRKLSSSKELQLFKDTAFHPPTNNEKSIQRWCHLQASFIAREIKDTQGGCLVLCTSYEKLEILTKALKKELKDTKETKVCSFNRGVSISAQAQQFKNIYKSGKRPVWVAISNAGTGLDISDNDSPAEKDTLLSNLFVTSIPISAGDNQSHMSKVRDALLLTRQFFGRLVRRPGRKNLRIYMLDARANVSKGWMKQFQTQINKYQIEEIKPEK